uniref:uncharacterized protein LOC127061791 n=1 Tax=Vespula vulgaris TaxID=7454 RepID=UPI00223ABF7C|nr:uncharacterized protein LOC127061791 [Vespula vulgaris]
MKNLEKTFSMFRFQSMMERGALLPITDSCKQNIQVHRRENSMANGGHGVVVNGVGGGAPGSGTLSREERRRRRRATQKYRTAHATSTYISAKKFERTQDIFLQELGSIPYFFFSSICKVVFINYTCDETTQKMEKINEIIYTFYAENTDYIIQEELKMFTLQMAHCQSTYSTFGLYSFNRKYIYSCLGVMMTYLTIMIQMS